MKNGCPWFSSLMGGIRSGFGPLVLMSQSILVVSSLLQFMSSYCSCSLIIVIFVFLCSYVFI